MSSVSLSPTVLEKKKKKVLSIYPKSFFFKLQRGPFVLEFDE